MSLPNIVVLHLAAEAAGGSDLTAGLAVLPRRRFAAIGVGHTRHLQEPASAVGTAFRHKALLQPLHKLHIDEIQQPVKIHLFNYLGIFSFAPDTVLRSYQRRIYLRVLPQADTTDKSLITAGIDQLRQRFFSLAFFLFKHSVCKNPIQKPRIPLLNELNILDLLLHEGRYFALLIDHIFRKCLPRFLTHKFLDLHISEITEVHQIQSVERQRSKTLLHVHIGTRSVIIILFVDSRVQPVQQFLKRCDIQI